jgi:hypothetical protein
MKDPATKAEILAQIAAIRSMELGKLSEYQHPGRPKHSGSYHRLQAWQDGRNRSRHVRPEELPAVQEAIAGYARFRELTQRYAEIVVAETRQQIQDSIKKKTLRYTPHSKKRSPASSSPS